MQGTVIYAHVYFFALSADRAQKQQYPGSNEQN